MFLRFLDGCLVCVCLHHSRVISQFRGASPLDRPCWSLVLTVHLDIPTTVAGCVLSQTHMLSYIWCVPPWQEDITDNRSGPGTDLLPRRGSTFLLDKWKYTYFVRCGVVNVQSSDRLVHFLFQVVYRSIPSSSKHGSIGQNQFVRNWCWSEFIVFFSNVIEKEK